MPKIPQECPWEGGGLHIRTWRIAYKKVVRNFDSLEIAHL